RGSCIVFPGPAMFTTSLHGGRSSIVKGGGVKIGISPRAMLVRPELVERSRVAAPAVSVADGRTPTSERVVSAHILVSTLFLGLAAILYYLSMAGITFPDALTGALSYGRVRPAALIATMLGWLVVSLSGGIYYVLPRLTGVRLQAVGMA